MQLVFSCPHSGQVFHSENYRIVDNKGVATDTHGRRALDARVALNDPCPFCGEQHIYRADELACPLAPYTNGNPS